MLIDEGRLKFALVTEIIAIDLLSEAKRGGFFLNFLEHFQKVHDSLHAVHSAIAASVG